MEEVGAGALAIVVLALSAPNLPTVTSAARGPLPLGGVERVTLFGFFALALILVTAVSVGRRRSGILRVAGWGGLIVWLALKLA